mmetsp:Transcript_16312/g.28549  ORF Transcript_16312/g.28549 Transcript_16312/m.28549 type:complete len:966 (-) Transcript_16312:122-3019(-)
MLPTQGRLLPSHGWQAFPVQGPHNLRLRLSLLSLGLPGAVPWSPGLVAMCSAAAARRRAMATAARARDVDESRTTRKAGDANGKTPQELTNLRFSQMLLAVPRAVYLYANVFAVWWDYRRTRTRAEKRRLALGLPRKAPAGSDEPQEVEQMWEAAHRRNAPKVRRTVDRLRGFWVKVGQYLSSRPDVVPTAYIESLAGLQDGVAATSWQNVVCTLNEEFGPKWAASLELEREPLAAASIAQVHRGWLRDDLRTPVAVKVQHRGVDVQMKLDLNNFSVLLDLLRRFDPDQDWRPVASEWTSAVRSELDFKKEAQNLREVAGNMKRTGVKVIVPEPVEGWIAQRAMLMDFCEGQAARDAAELQALGVDRQVFLERVCQAFAAQIHEDGFFNADPHPGNVHVSTNTLQNGGDPNVPVLLDYGLTKRFEPPMRLAFARLMHASHVSDPDGLERALEDMGFIFEREPLEDLANMRRLFTAVPKSEVAAQRMDRKRELEKQSKEAEKAGSTTRRRRPVEAWPTELVFFLRVTGLLKGLASSLDVPIDYMSVMAKVARQTLRESVPAEKQDVRDETLSPSHASSSLQRRVEGVLDKLQKCGQIRGMQVSVAHADGRLLASACSGELGSADPRPVKPESLFCVFSAGKAPCAAAVLRMAESRKLRLNAPVAQYWTEFGQRGKESCTVEEVLRHRAGLADVLPSSPSLEKLLDLQAMEQMVAEASPKTPPGQTFSYHYLTFGWILAGLVRRVADRDFETVLRELIIEPLGLTDEMMLGVPEELLSRPGLLASLEVAQSLPRSSAGPAIPLLSPALFNMRKIRSACVPAANMHCSARALARFYAGLAPGANGSSALLGAEMLKDLKSLGNYEAVPSNTASDQYDSNPSAEYGLGMKVFRFSDKDGRQIEGIGHGGLGGSIGLALPTLGLGIAVTTNSLDMNGMAPKEVLAAVFDELNVSPPSDLQPQGVKVLQAA